MSTRGRIALKVYGMPDHLQRLPSMWELLAPQAERCCQGADMSTKQCKHCGAVKPIEEFRQTYPGSKCRACEREYSRHYYTRNTVAVRERQGAYRDENIELVRRQERESKKRT